MIHIEQGALRSFKEQSFAAFDGRKQQFRGIANVGPQTLGILSVFAENSRCIKRLELARGIKNGEDSVLGGGDVFDLGAEARPS